MRVDESICFDQFLSGVMKPEGIEGNEHLSFTVFQILNMSLTICRSISNGIEDAVFHFFFSLKLQEIGYILEQT